MSNTRRVVITGLGIITAIGSNLTDFWHSLIEGKCGIKEFGLFDHRDYRTHIAAEVKEIPDFQTSDFRHGVYRKDRLSRSDRLGLLATKMAMEDASIFPHNPPTPPLEKGGKGGFELRNMGVSIGVGVGGMLAGEVYYEGVYKRKKVKPSILISQQPATTADLIAGYWGLTGPRTTIMTACSSSAVALGHALDMIRLGYQDAMMAGGVESLCRLTYSGFNSLRLVDPEPCKPFDMKRNGLSLGEGAAFLILEELGHAIKRRARIYAEFSGYGLSCDAGHMTAPLPDGEGAAMAIKNALEDAGVTPKDVDYINAHGTATPLNDLMETRAIKSVLGNDTGVPVSSIKAMVGHTLGAAGAIEAVVSVLSIHNGIIPPTINYSARDPECDLDYVANKAKEADINIALSNSFAFGGNNACLVFRRWKE
ncbi:MAG: beta-ketoacyl-[acyl-carrier-protein] synthase family protein [Nitrospirota bacterium]